MFLKYIAPLFLFIVASAFSQDEITVEQAQKHYNEYQTVCGKVAQYTEKGGNTFINFGGKYPNQIFHIFITNDRYDDLIIRQGDNVCATGTIKNYKGKPEIKNPRDLKVIE